MWYIKICLRWSISYLQPLTMSEIPVGTSGTQQNGFPRTDGSQNPQINESEELVSPVVSFSDPNTSILPPASAVTSWGTAIIGHIELTLVQEQDGGRTLYLCSDTCSSCTLLYSLVVIYWTVGKLQWQGDYDFLNSLASPFWYCCWIFIFLKNYSP